MLYRALFAISILVTLSACSDSSSNNTANNGTNNGSNNGTSNGSNNSIQDMGADLSSACDPVPECADNERLVGCECVWDMDRKCLVDSDCRSDEVCKQVDEHRICWWTPPPVRVCPGTEGCDQGGDGVFYAGAASRSLVLEGFETPKPAGIDEENYMNFSPFQMPEDAWNDCGYDGICPEDEGYTAPDEGEGDGYPQGMWIAGFTNGRPAQTCPEEKIGCAELDCCVSKWAHDNTMVQVTVYRHNDITIAFAAVDAVGIFHSTQERVLERLPDEWGVDLLIIGATHNHEGPDMEGQWGPGATAPLASGVDPKYLENFYAKTVEAIGEAVGNLEPADVSATVLDVGTRGMAINDSRTPYIFDDNVPIVWARSKATGETISTMMSFANHAEVLWSDNPYITADFFGYVRKHVENGLPEVTDMGGATRPALPGVGGVTVLFAGAVGGLIYPGPGGARNYADEPVSEDHSWEAADAVGQTLASHVLGAINSGALTPITEPTLVFSTRRFLTDIENTMFKLAGFILKVFERDIYNTKMIGRSFAPGNPMVQSQTAIVRLGEVTFFTAPGEVFPETLVGGFPGKPRIQTPVVGDTEERKVAATCDVQGLPTPNDDGIYPCIIKKDAENPPDWTMAPDGPYGYELIPGEFPFFIGLGMDHLGYMVPEYDFAPIYVGTSPGDHYEETNAAGPRFLSDWLTALKETADALP